MAKSLRNMMGVGIGAQTAALLNGLAVDGLTATGSVQADAAALSSDVNVVTTVPSGSGVMLPGIPQPSDEILIANYGANSLNIYPAPGGTIQNFSVNAAVVLPSGAAAEFSARSGSANWIAISTVALVAAGGGVGSGVLDFSLAAQSGLLALLEDI